MKNLKFLFFCTILLSIMYSCDEDDSIDDVNADNNTECDFINYNGSTDCGSGFVAVDDDYCCPVDFPYWKVGSSSCYATCDAAENDGATQIIRGNNGNGGNGGGTNQNGEASFWIQSDLGCGPITVSVSGQGNSTINSFYSNGFPGCGANGNANFVLSAGNYTYNASCNGLSWQGNFTVNQNGCSNIELTSSGGGGGGGGGGNGCNWDKGNLVSVTGEFGTRCGNPNSVELLVTNDSNIKLKTFVCIRRSDGTYSGFGDVNGLEPGESFGGFVCEGDGQYIIYAEYFDIYLANGNCSYGGCP